MRKTGAALITLSLMGCDIFGPGETVDIGYLGPDPEFISISLPDKVAAGLPFEVEVGVYGSGSCTEVEGVEVVHNEAGALVRPWVSTDRGTCTADLRRFSAAANVTLSRRGRAEIAVEGRYGNGGDGRDTTVVNELWVR